MRAWPEHPAIYEINARVWLHDLGHWLGTPVNFSTVPPEEWDRIADLGFDAVWFMGAWERSPAGAAAALRDAALLADFQRALGDFTADDVVGSAYCVRRYVVDDALGGPAGLAEARRQLAARGVRLLLDYVPNHVAVDHPWAAAHPEYFVHGTGEDLRREPASFFAAGGGRVLAHGRDPNFPAWQDVLQLNAFDPGLRGAAAATVQEIAAQCDGVRCDMAMLMMNDIFERTWGPRAGARPADDFWPPLIAAVRQRHPAFRFLAEAYWDLEGALLGQGFDDCYDKTLYDRLAHGDAEDVRRHLLADPSFQRRLARFIENHDEPRAAATFPPDKTRAAAVTLLTLPGAKLLHEGQLEGRKVRVPVSLGRRPPELPDRDLAAFYERLLPAARDGVFRDGLWRLCERTGWPDNSSHLNILAWSWEAGGQRRLIVVNFSGVTSQAMVRLPWGDLGGRPWHLDDALSEDLFERDGDELQAAGLFVSLDPWRWHFLRLMTDG
ncbi:MAG TPA: alpha-amylase [bacterium]